MLFRQGDVQEHTRAGWLLSSVTAFGELNRMHQFKEKSGRSASSSPPASSSTRC